MEITFNCSNLNYATLLIVLYDLLENKKPGKDLEDCAIVTIDNFFWLLDEILDISPEIADIITAQGGQEIETPLLIQVTELARSRGSHSKRSSDR